MKLTSIVFASLVTLLTLRSFAADTALPVIAINEIETKDAKTYALWIARNNAVAKSKLGLDSYIRQIGRAHV